MVRPTREDIIIGYMIYLKYHPDFPLNPTQPPPECMNTNPSIDGARNDLVMARLFMCSVSFDVNPDGTPNFAPLAEDVKEPWRYICTHFNELDKQFPKMIRDRYNMVESVADNDTLSEEIRGDWIYIKEKLEKVRKDFHI